MVSPVRGTFGLEGRDEERSLLTVGSAPGSDSFGQVCALVARVGEQLLAEGVARGRVRTLIQPGDVQALPGGRVEIAPAPPDERGSDDARDLSYALGALAFTLYTGAAPPRRATMALAHERALRRLLSAADLDGEAADLLRRLLAWDPERRPWPEAAIEQLRQAAPPEAEATPPQPADEDAPTELASEEELAAGPGDASPQPDRFTVAEDREMLFFPDTTSPDLRPPLAPSASLDLLVDGAEPAEPEDPFSIPDQTTVVPFPYPFPVSAPPPLDGATDPEGHQTSPEDERTDPEIYRVSSEDERTDPEGAYALAAALGGDEITSPVFPSVDDVTTPGGPPADAALVPGPAPMGVRLDETPAPPAPVRHTLPPPQRSRAALWFGVALIAIVALALGLALARTS